MELAIGKTRVKRFCGDVGHENKENKDCLILKCTRSESTIKSFKTKKRKEQFWMKCILNSK